MTSDAATPAPASTPVAAPRRRRPLLVAGGVLLAIALGWGLRALVTSGVESTDDGQVEADVVSVGPRIPGQVLRVLVKDNQVVRKGQVLFELDPADLAARVHQAEAELDQAAATAAVAEASARGGLSTARAGVSTSASGLAGAAAQVDAARATVVRAEAEARRTSRDLARARELLAAEAVSRERFDSAADQDAAAQAALAAARAQLASAEEARRSAEGRVGEASGRLEGQTPVDAQIAVAHARVRSAQASLDLARNQLSYTRVMAPADGSVTRLVAREGALVAAGQVMGFLVPTAVYVVANYKETQVGRMQPGQLAEIEVDALPGRTLHGRVESISGGTGARFSLLPPDNASGNFVKVVERVPVRITITDPVADLPLRAGLSAFVTVRVR
jgi:membrane fusion protein (multidrug efflux system)